MLPPDAVAFIVPGIFFIVILGLAMQFLRAKDARETGLAPYSGTINLLLMLVMLILFIFLAMMIISNYAN